MRKLKVVQFVFRHAYRIGKITLFLSTLILGITAVMLWSKMSPPTITLCQLAQNPDLYKGQIVKVEADAVGGFGTIIITDKACQLPESPAGVWRTQGYELNSEVSKFYSESKTEYYKAKIVVTGRFDPHATPGCFTPKAAIHATNIELLSEITTQIREKPVPPKATDLEIAAKKFFIELQKAVASNKKSRVAAMMRFPIQVKFFTDPRQSEFKLIENQTEFMKAYEKIFSYSVKDYIAKYNPDKFSGTDYYMYTDFGHIGMAVSSSKDNNGNNVYDFKVRDIYGNDIEIDYKAALCGPTIDCYMKADSEQNERFRLMK